MTCWQRSSHSSAYRHLPGLNDPQVRSSWSSAERVEGCQLEPFRIDIRCEPHLAVWLAATFAEQDEHHGQSRSGQPGDWLARPGETAWATDTRIKATLQLATGVGV